MKQRIPRRSGADGAPVEASETGLATAIVRRFQLLGGVDLELPPREAIREPPSWPIDDDDTD